jgi:hemoglobin-like flavoprotein
MFTKLKNHVKGVFDVVGAAVDMIDDLGQLSATVIDLGSRHYHYGARKEHIQVC